MHACAIMKTRSVTKMFVVIALSATGCATTTTTRSTMYAADSSGQLAESGARFGTVQSVEVTTQHTEGRPVAGAAAGALAGGLIFGSGAAAAGGAVAGAALSSGRSTRQTFAVIVRFDDDGMDGFTYQGDPPFRPGDRVALTPDGLRPAP
jgi:outer membrane lipoprotein SlyB